MTQNQSGGLPGQWLGRSFPENGAPTMLLINVEARNPETALLIGVEAQFQLRTFGQGSIAFDGRQFTGQTWNYNVFVPETDSFLRIEDFYKQNKVEEAPATQATYTAKLEGHVLKGSFENNRGQRGRFEVQKGFSEGMTGNPAAAPEVLGPMSWDDFKIHVKQFTHRRGGILFRGQDCNLNPLRTLFHRSGRNNLLRYVNEDVKRLRHQINAVSPHCYQPTGEDLLGLLSLGQHHGFPTPLLDWSQSPYVAAFFAYDCLKDKKEWYKEESRPPVRIFTFDLDRWLKLPRVAATSLKDPWPDLQFLHPPALNNPRYYAQQSIAAFSNLDDIEGFVAGVETTHGVKCLSRIDVAAIHREEVEEELRFMGLSAATLFPGYEGICRSIRAEHF